MIRFAFSLFVGLLIPLAAYGQTEQFKFTGTGQLGIGMDTDIPDAALHILYDAGGSVFFPPHLRLTEIGDGFTRIKMENEAQTGTFWEQGTRPNTDPATARYNIYYTNESVAYDVMSLAGSGNVGIGTSDPAGRLHIRHDSPNAFESPNLRITEIGDDYARLKMENTANEGAFWNIAGLSRTDSTQSFLNFFFRGNQGYNVMEIRGDGHARLYSREESTDTPDHVLTLHGPFSKRPSLLFSEYFGQAGMALEYDGRNSGEFNRLNVLNVDSIPITTFLSGGNIGMGTSSDPAARLHIQAEAGSGTIYDEPHLRLTEEGNGYTRIKMESQGQPTIFWEQRTLPNANRTLARYNVLYRNANIEHDVLTMDGSGETAFSSTETANTAPDKFFTLRSAASDRPALQFSEKNEGETFPGMAIAYDGRGTGGENKIEILDINDSPIATFKSNGSVGIGGEPGSSYKLQVFGAAAKTGGGEWTNPSDLRLKENISRYEKGLEDVLRIRPVHFRYTHSSGFDPAKEHVGVIAQELQEIAPSMISTLNGPDGEEYLGVNASEITYMLINAVKELSEQNEKQQVLIESLLKENAEIKTMMRESQPTQTGHPN